MSVKKYPFNATKYAHDLQFRKNRCHNTKSDMESGEIPWDDQIYDRLTDMIDKLNEALCFCCGGGVVWLPGELWALANESVLWAGSMRGNH